MLAPNQMYQLIKATLLGSTETSNADAYERSPDVRKAVAFTSAAFKGETRDNSPEAKRLHSIRVMNSTDEVLFEAGLSEVRRNVILIKAVLHDVIEDCPGITKAHIVKEFGADIAKGVERLSIPANMEQLIKIYYQGATEITGQPTPKKLKHRYKEYQAEHLLKPDELVIKALDNIDKPKSDAKDFRDGNLYIGHREFPDPNSIEYKNLLRRHYHEVYMRRLQDNDSIRFFGPKAASRIVELLDKQFLDAVNNMKESAQLTAGILAFGRSGRFPPKNQPKLG